MALPPYHSAQMLRFEIQNHENEIRLIPSLPVKLLRWYLPRLLTSWLLCMYVEINNQPMMMTFTGTTIRSTHQHLSENTTTTKQG